MHVLVLGGGAIGTSVAYALASRGAAVTLVERHAVAGAASGKSGAPAPATPAPALQGWSQALCQTAARLRKARAAEARAGGVGRRVNLLRSHAGRLDEADVPLRQRTADIPGDSAHAGAPCANRAAWWRS